MEANSLNLVDNDVFKKVWYRKRLIRYITPSRFSAMLDGIEHTLDVVPVIIGGRTMLPIIFVAESFGYAVDWDGSTETVTIRPQN